MRLEFQADDQPVALRPDYWQEVVGRMLCPLELRLDGEHDVPDRLVVGDVGPVQVAELTVSRPGGAERARRHVRRADPELYKIDVVARGGAVIEPDGRTARQAAGDLAFVDLSRPARWTNSHGAQVIAVSFPRALLPLRRESLARLTGVRVPGDRGTPALVSTLVRQLPRHLDDSDRAEGARVGGAVLDLLAAALAALLDRDDDVPADSRQRALLLRTRAFIEQQLGDPDLSPRSVAAAQYISIRYLHKLFEAQETTVADWIRRRRLERCRHDLLDPGLRAEPVSAIAVRWGLTNAAHFSRAFRAAYGVAPLEYRHRAEQRSSRVP
jgi:AraC-like DNA-binding protein